MTVMRATSGYFYLALDNVEASGKVSSRLDILVVVTFENACLKSNIVGNKVKEKDKTPSLTVV